MRHTPVALLLLAAATTACSHPDATSPLAALGTTPLPVGASGLAGR